MEEKLPSWISKILEDLKSLMLKYIFLGLKTDKKAEDFFYFIEEVKKFRDKYSEIFYKKCPIKIFFKKSENIKYPKAIFHCSPRQEDFNSLRKNRDEIIKVHSCFFLHLINELINYILQQKSKLQTKEYKYLSEVLYTTITYYIQFLEYITETYLKSGYLIESIQGLDSYFAPLQFLINPHLPSFRVYLIAIPAILRSTIENNLWKGIKIIVPTPEKRKIKLVDLLNLYKEYIKKGLVNEKMHLNAFKKLFWIIDILNCHIHSARTLYPWLIFPLLYDLNTYLKFGFSPPLLKNISEIERILNLVEKWIKEKQIECYLPIDIQKLGNTNQVYIRVFLTKERNIVYELHIYDLTEKKVKTYSFSDAKKLFEFISQLLS